MSSLIKVETHKASKLNDSEYCHYIQIAQDRGFQTFKILLVVCCIKKKM